MVSFSAFELFYSEKRLLGSYYGSADVRSDFHRILRLWRAGKIDLEGMISRRMDISEINEAFVAMRRGEIDPPGGPVRARAGGRSAGQARRPDPGRGRRRRPDARRWSSSTRTPAPSGPSSARFLTGLRDGRIVRGPKRPTAGCSSRPTEYDPADGRGPDRVGRGGHSRRGRHVGVGAPSPADKHPLDRPFAWALVRSTAPTPPSSTPSTRRPRRRCAPACGCRCAGGTSGRATSATSSASSRTSSDGDGPHTAEPLQGVEPVRSVRTPLRLEYSVHAPARPPTRFLRALAQKRHHRASAARSASKVYVPAPRCLPHRRRATTGRGRAGPHRHGDHVLRGERPVLRPGHRGPVRERPGSCSTAPTSRSCTDPGGPRPTTSAWACGSRRCGCRDDELGHHPGEHQLLPPHGRARRRLRRLQGARLMRDVAIVSFAQSNHVRRPSTDATRSRCSCPCSRGGARGAGIDPRTIGFTCSGSSDYLAGQAFSFVMTPRRRRAVAAHQRVARRDGRRLGALRGLGQAPARRGRHRPRLRLRQVVARASCATS